MMPEGAGTTREGGPIGTIAAVRPGNPSIYETETAHGLADGDMVRISTAAGPEEFYVKVGAGSSFTAFRDAGMTQPAAVNGVATGDTMDRLNAEDWAVVAGINYYPALSDLRGPVNDAREFRRWALQRGFVPKNQLKFIESPPQPPGTIVDARPTITELSNAFLDLAEAAEPKRSHRLGRRLYIFLSGHGIVATLAALPDYREAALLTADARPSALARHIGARAHAEWFRALGIFDEVILVADCCRDLEDNVAPNPPELPHWRPQRKAGRPFYAFPTMLGSKSFEREFGKPVTWRGIFSYVVVDALNNPKLYDDKGTLAATALETHLYTTVPNYNGKQNPIIEYTRDGPDIIFAKWFQRARQTVRIEFTPGCPGGTAELFRGTGTGKPLATPAADQNWTDDLDAGFLYKVAIRGTGRVKLFEVTGEDEVQVVTV